MKKILLLIFTLVLSHQSIAQADAFITTWVTTNQFEHLTLPAQPDAPNYTINWGDGSTNTYTATQVPSHTFLISGEHTVSFTGTFPHLTFVGQAKLKAVQQWGTQKWTSMANMFEGCTTFNGFPTQAPDLSLCTNMSYMFNSASVFNQDISSWNVSNVTNMSYMFWNASSFNEPIGSWDVSKVTNMSGMFYIASAFNQPIGSWDVSNVTNMTSIFFLATAFNQPIESWDVSKVTEMGAMFYYATAFNQPIGSWNVSNVKNMVLMFEGATAFNQPIGSWNVGNVNDMSYMFSFATAFNQPIESWDVSNVTNMSYMFWNASSFNEPIGSWDVSKVNTMSKMFTGAKLSTANYDTTLIGWSTIISPETALQRNVFFNAGTSKYCDGASARSILTYAPYYWTITDGGLDCTGLSTEDFNTISLKLYPNPVLSILNVDNNLTNQPYKIVDTLGKVILKGNLNEGDNSINVEQLSKGIYYLKVSDKNVSKFIKE